MQMAHPWQLFIDTGGTFTDAVAVAPDGPRSRAKVLTSGCLRGMVQEVIQPEVLRIEPSWSCPVDLLAGGTCHLLGDQGTGLGVQSFDPTGNLLRLSGAWDHGPGVSFEVRTGEEAPVLAARMLTGTPAAVPLPPMALRLGTTLATNALLTRSGAPTALFITRGFGDLLDIGTQQRPDLFALRIDKPRPLHVQAVEVQERLARDGSVLQSLDLSPLEDAVARLLQEGVQEAAVALLHSDVNPAHEQDLKAYLLKAGFRHVSCSADLAASIRILPRAATAVVNSYLAPIVETYLDRIGQALAGGRLLVMTSAGGLMGRASARPKDLLLSGPAGGVVGAALAGRASGLRRVISFDMGGTSTDVARYDGDYDYLFEHRVGDALLLAPALSIETVAAGGGSICRFDGTGLAVGPESAGSVPGPACYGAGGPLTLTDVNLLLGRLDPDRFGIPVSLDPARQALVRVLDDLAVHTGEKLEDPEVLEGFLALANERMADAIGRISLRRGYDPALYALVAFGGAGGQHACAVADRLGITTVIVPEDAGLLSAWGMAGAVIERFASRQLLLPVTEAAAALPRDLAELTRQATAALESEGVAAGDISVRRRLAEMRFVGQESTVQVEISRNPGADELLSAFAHQYETVYGHEPGERTVEVVSVRVVVSSPSPREKAVTLPVATHSALPETTRRAWFAGRWQDVPCFSRAQLEAGAALTGPALVLEAHSATVIEPGWQLTLDGARALVLAPAESTQSHQVDARPEAVQVELFAHRFETMAREMGEALRRTAVSDNVKERLDFSCALLDPRGELVVNAPHIPVHLGSLGICVRQTVKDLPLGPGDVAVTNHPAFGGSHLPDLTVIAPVYLSEGPLLGYTVARAHHAELGGMVPGSMPPAATSLAQEGVVVPPTLLIAQGRGRWDVMRKLLSSGPHPSRAIEDNIADLKAAVAACHRGSEALRALARDQGAAVVDHYMNALKERADRRMGEALAAIPDGRYTAEEKLDDGTPLQVTVTITGEHALIDFTGSAPVHPGNLNATPAIVRSVVIYVLRLLVQEDLPLNEGLTGPVELVVPPGILAPDFPDDPARSPSVVGGNVETSQRLTDTLIKALGLLAAGQGTMNNVIFGDDSFSYYETVCGGAGAGRGFAGAHAVHTHMTNTRITDPEVLEHNYPVRLDRFAIRCGSGGRGRFRGGDGVVREITFLAPLDLSILSQRRASGPFGMAGGHEGLPGAQRLVRAGGATQELKAIVSCRVGPGDRLELKTPGGGGWGTPEKGDQE
jgi:5-oxoprolinase (ATP-hydrolysing)